MKVNYTCEICGKKGTRCYSNNKVPNHFLCSVHCQHEWQKTRQDIVEKNKSPDFRKKVSEGLKRRKRLLGNNYHSEETKKKIGAATVKHWNEYDSETKEHMLAVLNENAQAKRTYGDYDFDWQKLSKKLRENGICHRCGKRENLIVHHIIPTKAGGSRERRNLVVLCNSCHAIVENQEKKIYEIIPNWDVIQILVRERLHCI